MILCVYCGNEMEDEARVCPSCGREVELPENMQDAFEPEVEEPAPEDIKDAQIAPQSQEVQQADEPVGEEDNPPYVDVGEAEPGGEVAEVIQDAAEDDADGEAVEPGATDGPEEAEAILDETADPAAETDAQKDQPAEPAEETTALVDEPVEPAKEVDKNPAEKDADIPEEDIESIETDAAGGKQDDNASDMEAAMDMAISLTESAAEKEEPVERGAKMSFARAVSALVCGIAGVALSLVPIAGLVLSIIAMALGAKARSDTANQRRGMAVAGFILGVVGLVVGIGALIWWIVILTSGAKVFWLLGSLV